MVEETRSGPKNGRGAARKGDAGSSAPIDDIERFDDEGRVKDRQFVVALARGLELLRCFRPGERWLGVTELGRRSGIPKPSVSRLAGTLVRLGYLEYSPASAKYGLGPGVLSLGYAMLSNIDIRAVARPAMEDLAEWSRASVSLGVRDRLSMVYVESVRSSAPIALQKGVGARMPVATSAMGRAYYAGLAETERAVLADQIRARDEDGWPALRSGLERAVRDVEERGFCLSMGEWDKEIVAVGVPFRAPDGTVMAFNCGGPGFQLTLGQLEDDIGPRLVDLVDDLGRRIGRPSTAIERRVRPKRGDLR